MSGLPGALGAGAATALVIGESIVDIVQKHGSRHEYPGGSPANVAYGLARLGVETELHTQLGDDRHGAMLREHLADAGVTVRAGRPASSTSTALAVVGESGAADYEFDVSWTLAGPIATAGYAAVHSGSIASFLAPGAAAVRRAFADARSTALVSYDPNIRPALIGARRDAVHTVEELAALAHVVKLSDEDARWLYPEMGSAEVLGHLGALGPRLVAITTGGNGVMLRAGRCELSVAAPAVQVADTIGAGDSFMSALIHGLLLLGGAPLDAQALDRLGRHAVAAAAITVSRPGANPPSAAELPSF